MIKFFLSRVLAVAAKVPWDRFLDVVSLAQVAARDWPKHAGMTDKEKAETNAERAVFVSKWILQFFPNLSTSLVNLVRELAVWWLNRTTK